MATAESPTLAEQIAGQAEAHVQAARQWFDLDFDYSPQSLQLIDHVITHMHGNQGALETTVLTYGAYVGETVRRALGGTWKQAEDGTVALHDVGGGDGSATVFPFGWVAKRFANGEEDLISYKYTVLLNVLKRDNEHPPKLELPDMPPAPPTAEPGEALAETDESEPGQPQASDEEILDRSPLLVFLMVAAADGDVDNKEIVKFQKVLIESAQSKSPLFRAAVQSLPSRLQEFSERLAAVGALSWMLELMRVQTILDEQHASEARDFKESLYAIAKSVAESSGGGWFGLGSKISKEERTMLELISTSLELTK